VAVILGQDHLAMTRPATSSRVVLVEDRRGAITSPTVVPLRRFRLARLRFDGPSAEPDGRYEYLKNTHD
jgi:hypothetical protein